MAKLLEVVDGLKRLEAAIRPVSAKTAAPANLAGQAARRWVGVRPSALKPAAQAAKPVAQAAAGLATTGLPKPGALKTASPLGFRPQSKLAAGVVPAEPADPFAMGMIDGEMGSHLYLERFKTDAQALLKYMNGKRLAEQNKAQAAAVTKATIDPLKPKDPMAQQQGGGGAPAAAGAKPAKPSAGKK
jgi:hypothetical protein